MDHLCLVVTLTSVLCSLMTQFVQTTVHSDASQDKYSVELKVVFKVNGPHPPNPAPVNVTFDSMGKTAFSVLDAAKDKTCYNFTYSLGPEYGAFIKSMCDVENDSAENNYWSFYVNGVKQDVGVTCYTVKPNDVIEMRYEHYGTHHIEL